MGAHARPGENRTGGEGGREGGRDGESQEKGRTRKTTGDEGKELNRYFVCRLLGILGFGAGDVCCCCWCCTAKCVCFLCGEFSSPALPLLYGVVSGVRPLILMLLLAVGVLLLPLCYCFAAAAATAAAAAAALLRGFVVLRLELEA